MKLYRLKAVLHFVRTYQRNFSVNEVAVGLGMSWESAKKDLEHLADKGYLKRKPTLFKTKKDTRHLYSFNYEK